MNVIAVSGSMIAVSMVVVIMSARFVGALIDPATDVGGFSRRIEQCRAKQRIRRNLAV